MIDFATLASIVTVLAVIAFGGIVAWTMSARQSRRFTTASLLPFALPDEAAQDAAPATDAARKEEQS